MAKVFFVFILASERNGTLYTGVTNDLVKPIWQHKNGEIERFTKKCNVHVLVWYDVHGDINAVIGCERQFKGWNRAWKPRMLEKINPDWDDFYEKLVGQISSRIESGSPSLARRARRG